MASAAYQIGAAASEIVVSPTAIIGSLGVIVARSQSAADPKAGARRYEFVSSQTPNKRPNLETDEGRAAVQALADRLAGEFLTDIAFSRGMSVEAMISATGGGGMITGREAVASGLADRIGGFEETLARLAAGDMPPVRKRRTVVAASYSAKENPMTTSPNTSEPVAVPTAEAPAPVPIAVAPPAAPVAPALDPVAAERARASAINGASKPGFQALATLAINEGWTVDTFAAAQAASASAVAAAGQAVQTATFAGSFPAPLATGAGTPDPASMSTEEQWVAAWDADAGLRGQFMSKDDYLAFKKAQASGRARIKAAA
jgi:ClpP class serine protease